MEYFEDLKSMLDKVSAANSEGNMYELSEAIGAVIDMIIGQSKAGKKLLFIGNGASASIASHMATDFWKNAGIRAWAFNDSSLLTCISNDYGYEHVFQKPIEVLADSGDVLLAISSSGRSENILRASSAAKDKGLKVVTFSGFEQDNPLRKIGDINFYVPAAEYGPVEVAHLGICHCLVDMTIKARSKVAERV